MAQCVKLPNLCEGEKTGEREREYVTENCVAGVACKGWQGSEAQEACYPRREESSVFKVL